MIRIRIRWPLPGTILAIAGGMFMTWARAIFRRRRAVILPADDSRELITWGPFAWSRNPMYLGGVVMFLGIGLIVGSIPMLLVPVLLFIILNAIYIPFEERNMERLFGDAYRAYRRRVRRWL